MRTSLINIPRMKNEETPSVPLRKDSES